MCVFRAVTRKEGYIFSSLGLDIVIRIIVYDLKRKHVSFREAFRGGEGAGVRGMERVKTNDRQETVEPAIDLYGSSRRPGWLG